MTVVFGLRTKIRVHMRTTLENGVLRNGQQPGRAVNNFFDQGNSEAIRHLVVGKLHAVISINFVLKSR